jgi:hypothetical protein
MTKASSTTSLAVIGPKKPPAAAFRRIPSQRIERFSLDLYLAAGRAPDRIALCPRGEDLDADLAFLSAAKARLLWPAPPWVIAEAIAGLLTNTPPARRRRAQSPAGPAASALLLEGVVTRARARAALASSERLWVVESVRCVRLSVTDLAELARAGVRWAALRPVKIVGVFCSPSLSRALEQSKRGLPRGAKLWRAANGEPSRRPLLR